MQEIVWNLPLLMKHHILLHRFTCEREEMVWVDEPGFCWAAKKRVREAWTLGEGGVGLGGTDFS